MAQHDGYLLGLDIGSSSIKASVVSIRTGRVIASCQSPSDELEMIALKPGWAEQDPETWWQHTQHAVRECLKASDVHRDAVLAIGIAYQMHGLVLVDAAHQPLRNSIIWCDSRAVEIGDGTFAKLGQEYCLSHLLNSPGNFTASKLRWVKVNEPELYKKIHKAMLPGDFIAMKLTGEITTTETGLSEGIFWDFGNQQISTTLLNAFEFDAGILPRINPVFSPQGALVTDAATALGLRAGTPVSYRSGDQPNNAFSLNVLEPGEVATNAGTSGVIYSVTDKNIYDPKSRVNTFLHVNNEHGRRRNGVLMCVNGTGIQNSWLRKNIKSNAALDYGTINQIASAAPIGSKGVTILPFGNGSERILGNREIESSIHGINFNLHDQSHLFRAAQEGIVFALCYGFEILNEMNLKTSVVRAGKTNMFQSGVFREALANTLGKTLEMYDSDGAKGAALGAGLGAGIFSSTTEALSSLALIDVETPDPEKAEMYASAFGRWKSILDNAIR